MTAASQTPTSYLYSSGTTFTRTRGFIQHCPAANLTLRGRSHAVQIWHPCSALNANTSHVQNGNYGEREIAFIKAAGYKTARIVTLGGTVIATTLLKAIVVDDDASPLWFVAQLPAFRFFCDARVAAEACLVTPTAFSLSPASPA
jgi:hypothetical protein